MSDRLRNFFSGAAGGMAEMVKDSYRADLEESKAKSLARYRQELDLETSAAEREANKGRYTNTEEGGIFRQTDSQTGQVTVNDLRSSHEQERDSFSSMGFTPDEIKGFTELSKGYRGVASETAQKAVAVYAKEYGDQIEPSITQAQFVANAVRAAIPESEYMKIYGGSEGGSNAAALTPQQVEAMTGKLSKMEAGGSPDFGEAVKEYEQLTGKKYESKIEAERVRLERQKEAEIVALKDVGARKPTQGLLKTIGDHLDKKSVSNRKAALSFAVQGATESMKVTGEVLDNSEMRELMGATDDELREAGASESLIRLINAKKKPK